MMYAALLAAAAATASQTTPTPDILDLDANITHTLATHEVAVVNFYAPWCAHCIRFEGEYSLAASKVPQVTWARLDCALHRETSELHKVEGTPTSNFTDMGASRWTTTVSYTHLTLPTICSV